MLSSRTLRNSAFRGRAPGVYVERLAPSRQRGPRRTDVAGFIGLASTGPAGRPVKVGSFQEFVEIFGPPVNEAHLGWAVEGFFANGGAICWVVRLVTKDALHAASGFLLLDGRTYRVVATAPGEWGTGLDVTLVARLDAIQLVVEQGGRVVQTLRIVPTADAPWLDGVALSTCDEVDRARGTKVVVLKGEAADWPESVGLPILWEPGLEPLDGLAAGRRVRVPLRGGTRGIAVPGIEAWRDAVDELERVDEVSLLAAPDLSRLSNTDRAELQAALVDQCERLGDRVAILDPSAPEVTPSGLIHELAIVSPFAAFYWPWLKVPWSPGRNTVRDVPPSGHVCGAIARSDLQRGVHAPPANLVLEGVSDLRSGIDDDLAGHLNEQGVNLIRAVPGRGIRIMGARTLADAGAMPEWRFLATRRLVSMVCEALAEELAWTVFEMQGPELWGGVERDVHAMLFALWRAGQLNGARREEAFFVRCDATTNPPDQAALGRVVCVIGLRPPPPAEFVLLRLTFGDGTVAVEPVRGGQHG